MTSTNQSKSRSTRGLVWLLVFLLIGVAVALGYIALFVPAMLEKRGLWLIVVSGVVLSYLIGNVLLEYLAFEVLETLPRMVKIGVMIALIALCALGLWLGLREAGIA